MDTEILISLAELHFIIHEPSLLDKEYLKDTHSRFYQLSKDCFIRFDYIFVNETVYDIVLLN